MRKPILVPFAILACLTGCGRDPSPANAQTTTAGAAQELPAVLATIGHDKITLDDVRERQGDELAKLDIQYQRNRHRLVQNTVQEIIRERILAAEAKKQGKSVEELIEAAGGRSLYPTEAEVATWFAQNQARLSGRTLDQVRPQIAEFLRTQRREVAIAVLEARLNKAHNVVVNLEPFRLTFDNAGAARKGPSDATVTLVEFADFQCPFCAQFGATLSRVREQFGDKVTVVYRHFPIVSIHPNAFKAAEASECAGDQGKFWELHDLMYAEQRQLGVNDLKEKARRLSLDSATFDACLDSGKHAERVKSDYQEGERAGITGTPALFVNGEQLEGGAVGYEAIAGAIENELARIKQQ